MSDPGSGYGKVFGHLGLPEGYRGAAGLLAALEVGPARLREAVTAEPGGVRG
jgi:hypothetical protein